MFSLIPTFLFFTFSRINPIPLIIIFGISYSLVPAVFWTLIPLISNFQLGKLFIRKLTRSTLEKLMESAILCTME